MVAPDDFNKRWGLIPVKGVDFFVGIKTAVCATRFSLDAYRCFE